MASKMSRKKPENPFKEHLGMILNVSEILIALTAAILLLTRGMVPGGSGHMDVSNESREEATRSDAVLVKGNSDGSLAEETGDPAQAEETEVKTDAPKDPVPSSFQPHAVSSTEPSNLIEFTEVSVDGEQMDVSEYQSPFGDIRFGAGSEYTDVDGIVTFRGNNYRNRPAYGFADYSEYKLNGVWSNDSDGLEYNGNTWTGSGWTGQPLMARWPREVKAHMNMEDWAKEKDDLVEVIYACMDGYVYFMDLETGQKTREDMWIGYTFKGAGALDPRGYPIMYLGAGINSYQGTSRAFIINLLDCSILYSFGNDDEFQLRNVDFFDSSALVDAETDTLIYPGENGILYLMTLNTSYDESAGTLSVNPSNIVKWRYWGTRTSDESYWLGMEDRADIYDGYLFIADNGGNLMCMDLNTLQLIWVQDILDDSNSTPVLSVEDGKLYLYVSTSFHLGWRSYDIAEIPIWKIDAETGEIVWQTSYDCYTEDGVSGGVQSTIALGEYDLSDYLYVTVSRTGDSYDGVLACLRKSDGSVEWEHKAVYAWSSPVCIYSKTDEGKVIYCSGGGEMYLLDGKTGAEHDTFTLSDGVIEASPAVYENRAVVGTRLCKIWCVEIS